MKNIILAAMLIVVFFPFDTQATPGVERQIIKDLRRERTVQVEVIEQPKCEPKQAIESNQKRPVRNLFKRLRNR